MRIGNGTNEYGTAVSRHKCDICGQEFTLCPAMPDGKDDTCGDRRTCTSYDPERDVDLMFEAGAVLTRDPGTNDVLISVRLDA